MATDLGLSAPIRGFWHGFLGTVLRAFNGLKMFHVDKIYTILYNYIIIFITIQCEQCMIDNNNLANNNNPKINHIPYHNNNNNNNNNDTHIIFTIRI